MEKYFLLCVLSITIVTVAGSKMEMPSYTKSGTTIKIECELDHEKHDIEHVKWYKDNQPFYIVVPANTQPVTTFDQPGVSLNADESRMNKITLSDVKESTSGLYTCELKTEHGMARMSGTLTVYSVKESSSN